MPGGGRRRVPATAVKENVSKTTTADAARNARLRRRLMLRDEAEPGERQGGGSQNKILRPIWPQSRTEISHGDPFREKQVHWGGGLGGAQNANNFRNCLRPLALHAQGPKSSFREPPSLGCEVDRF